MFTKLEILNAGLLLVGAEPMTSLTDKSPEGKKALAVYPFARQEAFAFPTDWCFCTSRTTIANRSETPTSGYSYMYNIPTDCIRPIAVVDSTDDNEEKKFRREVFIDSRNRQVDVLLTDDTSPIYLRYILFRENESCYPAYFAKLISTIIGYLLAEPLKRDKTKTKNLFEAVKDAMYVAQESNAMELGYDERKGTSVDDLVNNAMGNLSQTTTILRTV